MLYWPVTMNWDLLTVKFPETMNWDMLTVIQDMARGLSRVEIEQMIGYYWVA